MCIFFQFFLCTETDIFKWHPSTTSYFIIALPVFIPCHQWNVLILWQYYLHGFYPIYLTSFKCWAFKDFFFYFDLFFFFSIISNSLDEQLSCHCWGSFFNVKIAKLFKMWRKCFGASVRYLARWSGCRWGLHVPSRASFLKAPGGCRHIQLAGNTGQGPSIIRQDHSCQKGLWLSRISWSQF